MITPRLIALLRKNHEDIARRWLENCQGHIADEFQQMLETPMGRSVADSMYNLAMEYLEAEDYETPAILHRARESASNASFRRTAVGFSLPDIVTTAMAFRDAMLQTLLFHFNPADSDEEQAMLQCVLRLTRLGDAFMSGEIAGFFTFHKFGEDGGTAAEAV